MTVNGIYNEKSQKLTDAWVTKQTNGAQTTVDAYKQTLGNIGKAKQRSGHLATGSSKDC